MNNEEKKPWKETVHWISDHHEDGRVSYTGQSVNYGCICSSWESVEDLYRLMTAMIGGWIEHAEETMHQHDPLEMVECTPEEWESRDDNTTYWEMERTLRLIRKPEVQEKWIKIMGDIIYQGEEEDIAPGYIAERIMKALIEQPNE